MHTEVVKLFAILMGLPEAAVTDDLTPDDVEEWDSLRHLDLIVSLEDRFGVSFSAEEMASMRTSYGALRRVAEAKLPGGSESGR